MQGASIEMCWAFLKHPNRRTLPSGVAAGSPPPCQPSKFPLRFDEIMI
jgi:hypothetical protein